MAPFLKGKGDFGPVIPALWLQGDLPSSPVPHISVKGRTSSARRAARLDEQKELDLPDEQLITLIPFLLGAFPSMFLTWEQPGVGETLWTQGSCTSGAQTAGPSASCISKFLQKLHYPSIWSVLYICAPQSNPDFIPSLISLRCWSF